MKFVPQSVSRLAGRSVLKLKSASPTLLVVSGVIGLGASAVMAAKATRKIDPVLEHHARLRDNLLNTPENAQDRRSEQKALTSIYLDTTIELAKIYGPAIGVGVLSAAAVLGGHHILNRRHVATMMAFTGLQEQLAAYRQRVAKTLGEDVERDIYNGASSELEEDPDHKGEYKRVSKWDDDAQSYLRPWFDETNPNWTGVDGWNYTFLKGVQTHMNHKLQSRGHLFLNEVLDDLKLPRCSQGSVVGWVFHKDGNNPNGDNYVDFGFLTSNDPHTVAFRNDVEKTVRLNFNVDGLIWDKI